MTDNELINEALKIGFNKAGVISVDQLVYVPQYRKYCEENLCGNYARLPVCSPSCGTVEEMYNRITNYKKALVLQTKMIPAKNQMSEYIAGKRMHNEMMDKLISKLNLNSFLVMSAGPWKDYSCMSAYSIDAEKMAEACSMICWGNDGVIRFFSTILY